MKEPKRKPLKGKLSPRQATTFSKICSLGYDHCDTRNAWMSISERGIFICRQKKGQSSTEEINLTRKEFDKFVDWYNQKQQTFS